MTPEQFCYWMQGFAELNVERPTAEQWKSMREHLGTVFHKVTPPVPDGKKLAEELVNKMWGAPPIVTCTQVGDAPILSDMINLYNSIC